MNEVLKAAGLAKTFTLHARDGAQLPVFSGIDLAVAPGECVALTGSSGSGKSTLLRCLYGNYAPTKGEVRVHHEGRWVSISSALPREVIEVRRRTVGYVSQFLHVIPRVATIDIVAEPLQRMGVGAQEARGLAGLWLRRLNLAERLWSLPPATFSGGEQQRVNIAHGLIARPPVLLMDEPTASLDTANRQVVIQLIREARERGAAIVGIFHDEEVREAVATRCYDIQARAAGNGEPA